tara:strand:- start:4794 stop:5180 length:387 start_codon:yes stop_codon:yes gene_type:complete
MAEKLVRTRTAGYCDQQFAHDGRIEPGDIALVTTHMPSSEAVRDFGVQPFSRSRTCSWCLRRQMASRHSRERTHQRTVKRWFELTGEPEPAEPQWDKPWVDSATGARFAEQNPLTLGYIYDPHQALGS